MKIGVVGGGTVGRATALAYSGWRDCDVRVWDVLPERRTVPSHHDACACDVVFVCLPTPGCPDGSLDTSTITEFFGRADVSPSQVNYVIRSTVPIGYTRKTAERFGLRNLVHSPEFLTERTAQLDALMPSRLIIGMPNRHRVDCEVIGPAGEEVVINRPTQVGHRALYRLYQDRFPGVDIQPMSSDESEAVKLIQNGFAATKIAYFNEVRCLADKLGLDWETVREGVLSGGTVHPLHTMVPGPDGRRGFGGKCLPKDMRQLLKHHVDAGMSGPMLLATLVRNATDRPEGGAE